MFINRLKLWYSQMQKAFITTPKQCLGQLDKLQIPYKLYEHEAAYNMEDFSKVKLEKSPYIKNLFYNDRKSGAYFLILAQNNTSVNKDFLKKLGKNMRMAEFEKVKQILKVEKGTVNPFSLLNDHQKLVTKTFIDQKLYQSENWAFHPMDNTNTVELNKDGVIKFLEHHKINYQRANLEQATKQKKEEEKKKQDKKKQQVNLLGIQYKKGQDFSNWYSDVITKSGMLDYYDVSGCYIIRPWAFGIWERLQKFFDALIKTRGVQNAMFPMFVSKKALETQKQHVEGFAAEVAWVTKSGKSDLAQPIAIRPTSETIMYPAYANWIKSHRDLPLKLNQWTNIVRWQFKHPTPFIRTRQILWQEGHTAHATLEEAQEETFANLQFYRRVYQELYAVPVHKGVKTQSQKFAGGFKTTTVETWIPENGRAIQAATSHNLGQNFAKMFGIEFQDEKKQKKLVWQTSWGITTRSIGILVMHHGDDKGLVLPPKVVNIQAVIIPIRIKGKEEIVEKASQHIYANLKKAGIRVHIDDRVNYTPGWKYNHWQVKGVPMRIEIGPKDVVAEKVQCVLRYNGDKFDLKWEELSEKLPIIFDKIQNEMFENAKKKMDAKTAVASNWAEFMSNLNQRKVSLTPWCNDIKCQEKIKERSGKESKQSVLQGDATLTGQAKTLCIPLEHQPLKEGEKCFHCQQLAKVRVFWGRSY